MTNEDKKAKRKVAYVHPEIHKAVKVRAALEETEMEVVIHEILCAEFDRLDLIGQPVRQGEAAELAASR